jgi:hypothetical protein
VRSGAVFAGKDGHTAPPRLMLIFTSSPDRVGVFDARLAPCFNRGRRDEAAPPEVGERRRLFARGLNRCWLNHSKRQSKQM